MRSGLSRLFTAFTHYRDACNALRTPVSAQSRRGLDWMNFFIADVQAGFGAFVAFYLAQQGWSPKDVGVALGVGAAAGVLSQIPGGALADAVTWKRALVAAGIVMIGCAALILAVMPSFIPVLVAEILHGTTSGIVASHSLIPDALYHAFATFGALMSPDLPLTRRQHEMITTVVSVANRCRY